MSVLSHFLQMGYGVVLVQVCIYSSAPHFTDNVLHIREVRMPVMCTASTRPSLDPALLLVLLKNIGGGLLLRAILESQHAYTLRRIVADPPLRLRWIILSVAFGQRGPEFARDVDCE